MLRNFRIVKVRSLRPIRFCRKKTGLGEVSRTAKAITSRTGTIRRSRVRKHAQSKRRLAPD
jgi:hypothetical protein